MKALIAATFGFLVTTQAFAGPGDGGGGVGFVCDKGDGTKVTYLADTYDLSKSGALDRLKEAQPVAVVAAAARVVDELKPEAIYQHPYLPGRKVTLGWMIAHRSAQLVDRTQDKPLETLKDDNIAPSHVPRGCRKLQIAVQDISKMVVRKAKEADDLSWFDEGFLDLHETFVSLRGKPGADTTPIRQNVEEIAAEMGRNDSRIRDRILFLLNSSQTPYSSAEEDRLGHLLGEKCQSRILEEKPEPNDTPQISECRRISAQLRAASRLHDASTSLKTIVTAPRTMKCIVGAELGNDLGIQKPRSIVIQHVAGKGLPSGWEGPNTFRISVDGKTTDSKRSWFTTQRTMREAGFRDYGMTNLSAYYVTNEKKNIAFSLRDYDSDTQTFSGSISFSDPTVLSYPSTDYSMSCFTGPIAMGLDLENSEPSRSRPIVHKTPDAQKGCTFVIDARETRVQHEHQMSLLRGMMLKDPRTFFQLKRYRYLRVFNTSEASTKLSDEKRYDLYAEEDRLEQTPIAKQWDRVAPIASNPKRCVNFKGE